MTMAAQNSAKFFNKFISPAFKEGQETLPLLVLACDKTISFGTDSVYQPSALALSKASFILASASNEAIAGTASLAWAWA